MKTYSAGINEDIVCFIPDNSAVLDVGCADGAFGKFLKDKKNCLVFGIEKDKRSAKNAKKLLDRVFCIDIEKTKPKGLGKIFDVIVFADVLEHLKGAACCFEKIFSAFEAERKNNCLYSKHCKFFYQKRPFVRKI